ncbi:MAG: SRPBCC family protein [Bacteroidia bacterium]
MDTKTIITVETTINAPVEKVWKMWNEPQHITKWCHASSDWHAPYAENDLKEGGKFKTTMAAKDGSVSFDFEGTYTKANEFKNIEYKIGDGRNVRIDFKGGDKETKIIESFDAEKTNSVEMQKGGWQAILDNFKKYVETN